MSSLDKACAFLDRFRELPAIPWIIRFHESVKMVCENEPEMVSLSLERTNAINFQKKLHLCQIVDAYNQFQKHPFKERKDLVQDNFTKQVFADMVWGEKDLSRQEMSELAANIMASATKWTTTTKRSPRSPKNSSNSPRESADVTTPPSLSFLGVRRKSKVDLERKIKQDVPKEDVSKKDDDGEN